MIYFFLLFPFSFVYIYAIVNCLLYSNLKYSSETATAKTGCSLTGFDLVIGAAPLILLILILNTYI